MSPTAAVTKRTERGSAPISQRVSTREFAEFRCSGKLKVSAAVSDRAVQRSAAWQTPHRLHSAAAGRVAASPSHRRPQHQQAPAWAPMMTTGKQSGALASGQTAVGSGTRCLALL